MDSDPDAVLRLQQQLAWKMATQGNQLTLLDRLCLDTEPVQKLQQVRFGRGWDEFVRHHRSRKFYLNGPTNSGQLVDYFVFCYPQGPNVELALELHHYPLYRYLVDEMQGPIADARRFFCRAVQVRMGHIVLDLMSRPRLMDEPLLTRDYQWAALEFAEDGTPPSLAVCRRMFELAQQQGSHLSKRSTLRSLLYLEKRQFYAARAFYQAMGPWELTSQALLTMASDAGASQFIVDFEARWQQDLGPSWYRYLRVSTLSEVYMLLESSWRKALQPEPTEPQVLPEYELLLERVLPWSALSKEYDFQAMIDFASEFKLRLDFRRLFWLLLHEDHARPQWICALWQLMLELEGRSVLETSTHEIILRRASRLSPDDPYRRGLRNRVLRASPELLGR